MSVQHAEKEPMGGTTRYTALDHEGLEVLPPGEAPEVLESQQYNPRQSTKRKSSAQSPEVAAYYSDAKEKHSYFRHDGEDAPEYDDAARLQQNGRTHVLEEGDHGNRERRYCCGLRRRGMIILICCIALLVVVVGAVLGGVLGTMLGKNSSSSSTSGQPLQTFSNTGIASTVSAADPNHLLTYFQDPSGRILENSFYDNTWTLSNVSYINSSVVTTGAAQGSPLAAVSYLLNGLTYRQVFFTTDTGQIMSTNSTKTLVGTNIATEWSPGQAITQDAVAPSSIGLAACVSNDFLDGVRVYYPSQYNYVQELKYNFTSGNWKEGTWWERADVSSGVACAVKETGHQWLNVYFRLKADGRVKQVFTSNATSNVYWSNNSGPTAWSNHTIAAGSDIAVASDDSQTEYVYYQLEGGLVTRGILNPTTTVYETFENMPLGASSGTKLSAAFFNGGSMLMYQNTSSDSTLWTDNVSRYGATIMKGVVA